MQNVLEYFNVKKDNERTSKIEENEEAVKNKFLYAIPASSFSSACNRNDILRNFKNYDVKCSSVLYYDYLVKLIIIGDSNVGKSCMLIRFSEEMYNTNYLSTVGIDFKIKYVFYDNKRIKVQIWDTAGQERFKTITQSYYRSAMGAVIAFDVCNLQSFNNVRIWLNEIELNASADIQKILVGNKADMPNRKVTQNDAIMLAKKLNIEYIETSALTGQNINAAFLHLIHNVYNLDKIEQCFSAFSIDNETKKNKRKKVKREDRQEEIENVEGKRTFLNRIIYWEWDDLGNISKERMKEKERIEENNFYKMYRNQIKNAEKKKNQIKGIKVNLEKSFKKKSEREKNRGSKEDQKSNFSSFLFDEDENENNEDCCDI